MAWIVLLLVLLAAGSWVSKSAYRDGNSHESSRVARSRPGELSLNLSW